MLRKKEIYESKKFISNIELRTNNPQTESIEVCNRIICQDIICLFTYDAEVNKQNVVRQYELDHLSIVYGVYDKHIRLGVDAENIPYDKYIAAWERNPRPRLLLVEPSVDAKLEIKLGTNCGFAFTGTYAQFLDNINHPTVIGIDECANGLYRSINIRTDRWHDFENEDGVLTMTTEFICSD